MTSVKNKYKQKYWEDLTLANYEILPDVNSKFLNMTMWIIITIQSMVQFTFIYLFIYSLFYLSYLL